MAWDSTQTAQMVGMYQGMAMNQMAYSNQIGQQGPMYGSTSGITGDRMMGGAMNAAASFGGPMASAASSLAPLAMMGMGMGGMAATGVGMPIAAGLAAGQHVGSQMYTGAQQQQSLNQTLRGSFSFQNPYGGTGFTRSDMSQIGTQIRGMSEQFGSGGEIASFKELSSLAGKMGQMGFAQGVRDVQEFGKRFKEMTTALKTMARDLGTTLEGAMEFAASAKGSGIFGTGKVTAFTGMARATAVSGGLAMSEVTGAANIGSQIARSIGGLGSQGANAGMRTIGQIGTAQQMGVLSEEDIYNVTGQTGAEGRQSYAASSMQRTGRFLQSGRGRRVLASLAEKDGGLNEENVQELLTGGMGIGETMRRDKQQLGKVGRANFIRNEGRLRGAAMERLGGFLPALQLQEWAQSKGVDINNMDDRSMLFAQRQLGMGRDEVDQAVKMANNMPQIIERQRRDSVDDQYMQKLTQARKGQGVQGIQQRLEQAREIVNGKMQKAGQDFFNQGSEGIDKFFNQLAGQYVQTYSKDIDDSYRSMMSGGALGRSVGQRAFGVGGGGMSKFVSPTAGAFGGSRPGDLAAQMAKGSSGDLEHSMLSDLSPGRLMLGGAMGLLTGETAKYLLGGQSDVGKLQKAGFDFRGLSSEQVQKKMSEVSNTRLAAATGFDKDQVAMGAKNADWLRDAYALDRVAGEGDDRMRSFGEALKSAAAKNPEAKAAYEKWTAAKSQAEKAQLMGNMERGAQIGSKQQLTNRYGLPDNLMAGLQKGGFAGGAGEENEAYANAFGYGDKRSRGEKLGAGAARGLLVAGGQLLGGALGATAGAALGGAAEEYLGRLTGSYGDKQKVGAFLKGEQYRDLSVGLLSGDESKSGAAAKNLQDEIGKRDDGDPVKGVMQDMLGARRYLDLLEKTNGKPSAAQEEEIAKATGMSVSKLREKLGAMGAITKQIQSKDAEEERKRVTARATKDRDKLGSLGVYDAASGGLSKAKATELGKIGAGAAAYAQKSVDILNRQVATGGVDEETMKLADERGESLQNLSLEDKRKVAASLVGTEAGAEAGRAAGMQSKFRSLSKRGGAKGALNQVLGAGLSKDELKGLDASSASGAAALAERAGIGGNEELQKMIQRAGTAGKKGGADEKEAAEILRKIVESPQFQDAQKKKQTEQAESADPIAAAIKANTTKANEILEAMRKTLVNSNNLLVDIKGVKDPEK